MKENCLLVIWFGIYEGELLLLPGLGLVKVNCLLFTWIVIGEGELFAFYLDWD